MSLQVIGMIFSRPTSDIEAVSGPEVQPDFIERITKSHEDGGFDRVLVGYWTHAADGFLVAAHAGAAARKLNFLIAHRPGFVAPTLAARKLATLDNLLGGRLALHVISGGSDADQRKDGDYLSHDERYARTEEFIRILKSVWTSDKPVSHNGQYYRFEGAASAVRSTQTPHIPIYFGGVSDAAIDVAARHADLYAFFGEPLADAQAIVRRVRSAAQRHGRAPAFSWSNRPILGRTEKEAWERAHSIFERAVAYRREQGLPVDVPVSGASTSQRLVALAGRGEVLDERLWTPMTKILGGGGNSTSLVGTPEQVARAMLRYRDLGIDSFIIRGWDHEADAAEYGRDLVPVLKDLAAREDRGAHSVAVSA